MKMTLNVEIHAPPERVWAVFTDFHNAASNISGIKKLELLTDGPIGNGTRFRETRVMFGREAVEVMEIADFQPNRGYAVQCDSCGMHYRCEFTFDRTPGGTHVQMSVNARPLTFFARLMSPLGKLMAGSMKKAMQKDLEDLKAVAENAPQPT